MLTLAPAISTSTFNPAIVELHTAVATLNRPVATHLPLQQRYLDRLIQLRYSEPRLLSNQQRKFGKWPPKLVRFGSTVI